MPQVFNTQTQRVEEVTPEVLAQYPHVFQPVAEQQTYMVAPDGKSYNVPAKSTSQAAAMGWKYVDPQQSASFKEEDKSFEENKGALNVGFNSFVNQALFGVPEIVEQHSNSEAYNKGVERAKADSPAANWIGGGLGLLGGTIATGGIGEAVGSTAERAVVSQLGERAITPMIADAARAGITEGVSKTGSLLQRALGSAANTAAQGALYSAPSAVAQAAYGDPEKAAENLLIGTGVGGLLGLGAGFFTGGAKAAQELLRDKAVEHGLIDEAGQINHETFQKMADESMAQNLGISKKDAERMGLTKLQNVIKMVKEDSLENVTRDDLLSRHAALGEAIGEHSAFLDSALTKQDIAGDHGIAPGELANKVQSQILEERPGLLTPMMADDRKELDKIAQSISEFGGNDQSMSKLQDIKQLFGSEYANTLGKSPGMLSNREKMLRQAYDIIKNEQEAQMGKAYNSLDLSDNYTKYLSDKSKYAATSDLLKYGPQQFDNFGNPLTQKVIPTGLRNTWIKKGAGIASSGVTAVIDHALGMGGLGFFALKPVVDTVLEHTLIDKGMDVSNKLLRKLADDPESMQWIGTALTKELNDAATARIATIPAVLAGRTVAHQMPDVLKSMLGGDANGLSKDQQYNKVSQALTDAASNPQQLQNEIQTMSAMFGQDPRLQQMLASKQAQAITYLSTIKPKTPAPLPFTPANAQPSISKQDKQAFLDKLEVVHNPWTTITHMKDGTINDNHLETLKAVYPKMYDQFVGQCLMMAYDPKYGSLPAKTIEAVERFTGLQLNPANRYLAEGQAIYAPPPQASQGMPPRGKGKGSHGGSPTFTKFPSLETNTSRIANK